MGTLYVNPLARLFEFVLGMLHVGVERPARRLLLRKRKAQGQEKRTVQAPEEAEVSAR
jgi:hypothetical protein